MKLILDTCVWGGAKATLTAAGHEVIWMGDLAQDPGDREILAQAYAEGRILITQDKDFGELAIRCNLPHHGIVRLVNIPARRQGKLSLYVLATYEKDLAGGAILTVETGRIRIRPGEPGQGV